MDQNVKKKNSIFVVLSKKLIQKKKKVVCSNCEILFNLCETCESKIMTENDVHNKYHVFIKIPYSCEKYPNDIVISIENQQDPKKISIPKMPLLYEMKKINLKDKKEPSRVELRSRKDKEELKPKKKRVNIPNHFSDKKIRLIVDDDIDALMKIEEESFAKPYDIDFFHKMVYISKFKDHCGLWVVELTINEKNQENMHKEKESKFGKFFRNIFTKSVEIDEFKPTSVIGGYIALKMKRENVEIVSLAVSKKCRGKNI